MNTILLVILLRDKNNKQFSRFGSIENIRLEILSFVKLKSCCCTWKIKSSLKKKEKKIESTNSSLYYPERDRCKLSSTSCEISFLLKEEVEWEHRRDDGDRKDNAGWQTRSKDLASNRLLLQKKIIGLGISLDDNFL